ncbi:MAG: secretin N-terminal domain-containing protein, partial [Candidatus Methylomirabilales bacterium]
MRWPRPLTTLWVLGLLMASCATSTGPLTRGDELIAVGNYDAAVRYYMEVLSRDPKSVEVRLKLVQAFRDAAEAHYQRGHELEQRKLWDAALDEYQRTLLYRAENVRTQEAIERVRGKKRAAELLVRARKQLDKGELRRAAQGLAEAKALDPENPEVLTLFEAVGEQLQLLTDAAEEAARAAADEDALSLVSTKPVTLRFKDTDIKDVMEIVSKLAGVNILLDDGIRVKKVTTFVKELPLRQALSLLLTTNRLFAKPVGENSLIVIPDTPAKHRQYDDLMVRTFYLSKVEAKAAVNLLRTILNTRQVFVNEKLNALVVRDTPEKIMLAEKLLEANDRGSGEVEIELEILEVDRTRLKDMGIFITDQYQVFLDFGDFATAKQFESLKLNTNLLFTNPSLTLNLIKNDAETKTLANPTLRVLDRQKASILIGERRPFQISQISSTTATTAQPGTTPSGTIQETRVEFRDVGLKLTLTPIIHLDNEVTVELNFEISSIGELVGGDLLPSVNTRTLNTFIKIKDGETRLLGGLIQDEERTSRNFSPFLGSLPIIGRLFRDERRDKVRRDVVISLTPRLVKVIEQPAPSVTTFWSGTGRSFE